MTNKLNETKYEGYDEAMAFFEQEEAENFPDVEAKIVSCKEEEKHIHRKHRKNDYKAKKRQLALAGSVKRKRKSPFRWNPVWHKMKLVGISPQKFKVRLGTTLEKDAIKDFHNI